MRSPFLSISSVLPKHWRRNAQKDGSRVPPEPPVPPRLAYLVRTNPGAACIAMAVFFRCTSLVENKRLSALFTASETYSAVCLSTAMYSSTAECLSRTLRQDHCYGRPRSLWIFSGFRQSVNGRCNAAARCSSHWDTSGSSWSSKCDSCCPRRFFVGKLGAYTASV